MAKYLQANFLTLLHLVAESNSASSTHVFLEPAPGWNLFLSISTNVQRDFFSDRSPDQQDGQNDLGSADLKHKLRPLIEGDLVVFDDLFLAKRISESAGELLPMLVHQRYKLRRSIVVTSNWARINEYG